MLQYVQDFFFFRKKVCKSVKDNFILPIAFIFIHRKGCSVSIHVPKFKAVGLQKHISLTVLRSHVCLHIISLRIAHTMPLPLLTRNGTGVPN